MIQALTILFVIMMLLIQTSSNFHRLELFGNRTLNYYYTRFYIGRPLQYQTLLIDTGSYLSVISCAKCRYCHQKRLAPLYDLQKSFSSTKMKCKSRAEICQQQQRCKSNNQYCQFFVNYLDGSNVIGDIIEDEMSFDNIATDIFRANFGCIDFQREIIDIEANGIMGLGPKSSENILYKWFQSRPDSHYQFATCLGSDGGYIQFGRNPAKQAYDVVLNFDSQNNFYSISGVTAMRYGRLNVFNQTSYRYRGAILDTGSTLSFIPTQYFQSIITQSQKVCSRIKKKCLVPSQWEGKGCFIYTFARSMNPDRIRELDGKFPNFQIEIDGATLNWYPRHYFQIQGEIQGYGSQVCLTIRPEDKYQSYLFGDTFMRQKKFVYNLKAQTISIIDNQTCKYEPYGIRTQQSQTIQEILENVEIFVEKYGIYVIAVAFLIFIFFRKHLGALFISIIKKYRKKSDQLEQEKTSDAVPEIKQQEMMAQSSIISSMDTVNKNTKKEVTEEK